MRVIALAVVAIQIGLGGLAHAQTTPDSDAIRQMLPLFAKNHCEEIKNPADQLFCGDPELSGVVPKLNGAVQARLDRTPNRRLAIEENAKWIRDRNSSCGIFRQQSVSNRDFKSVKDCLLLETEERIEILQDPNFDCLANNTTAGLLICGDPTLALARGDLNGQVLGLIAKLKDDEARQAFDEFDRWGRERDRKCDLAGKDNVPLAELSSSEGCLGEYFTGKLALVAAAKGDPKRIFGRNQASLSPDADAVDICVGQIHLANACGDFLAIDRVSQIDRKETEKTAAVIADVEMVVLSPFAVCSPVALGCTGTCWDPKLGKADMAKPAPGIRSSSFFVATRLKIKKSFAFQKTENGNWRCSSTALSPVETRGLEKRPLEPFSAVSIESNRGSGFPIRRLFLTRTGLHPASGAGPVGFTASVCATADSAPPSER